MRAYHMMPPTRPTTSSSSATATEDALGVESVEPSHSRANHFQIVWNSAFVTDEALRHEYQGEGTREVPYLVEFLPNDSWNPMTFTKWKKWTITLLLGVATLAVTFASTAYSGGVIEIMRDFQVSTEVATLGISLFVLGFAVGPLLWAPMSELYGRQIIFLVSYSALTAFNAGTAAAQNTATLIILRFLAGAFGSSPLTNAGGVIADLFPPSERGVAAAIFATAPFLGPSIGPIVGGFLGAEEGWRWVAGVMAIFTGVLLIACALLVPETYAPVILRRRATELSRKTGKVYISKLEAHRPHRTVSHEFKVALSRPWLMLFREPIVLLTSIYMAIVYGTLYMMFAAFPIVYQLKRGWSPGVGGLAFIGIAVGIFCAVAYAGLDNKRYLRLLTASNGVVSPESRLPPAIVGSFLLPIGLFWFAWTNGPEIHWIVSIIASAFFAAGLVLVFLSLMGYLIDSYGIFSASVLAANSVLRSLFGAAFPLFTTHMYEELGIHWASSIPAFLALACIPFPLLFYRYGARIRANCRFSAEASNVLERIRTRDEDIDEDEAMAEIASHQGRRGGHQSGLLVDGDAITPDLKVAVKLLLYRGSTPQPKPSTLFDGVAGQDAAASRRPQEVPKWVRALQETTRKGEKRRALGLVWAVLTIGYESRAVLSENPMPPATVEGIEAATSQPRRRHDSTPASTSPPPVATAAPPSSLHHPSRPPPPPPPVLRQNPVVISKPSVGTSSPTLDHRLPHSGTPPALPANRADNASPQLFSPDWMQTLRLLHHYSTVVYLTLSRDPATAELWKTAVPESAFSHEFLMHGLLGVSALHYAHTHPDQEHEYTLVSSHYQNLALRYFTAHLPDLNDQNCKPFFFLGTFIFLLTTCSIARPRESEKPVTPEDIARSFLLIQGVKTIVSFKPIETWKQDGPLAPLIQMMDPVEVIQTGAFQTRMEHLSALARQVRPFGFDAINTQTACLLAIESLRTTHCACMSKHSMSVARRVWMWPMTLTQLFVDLIRSTDPLALIILAHYAALVRQYEHPDWINQGWSVNVMASVESSLDREWREWITWPKKSIQEGINVDDMYF
ncbi:hypothetical protein NM208_g1325 [Fusarium decemcellulare]|uniref:Uncharacterized protein n=1 Tax=Fusarium decemcellulare TaxID=57161 RepID=A0ACC1SWJ9_9HYPO|nr:hypothetical protein NM208_g1325 [Fusarium decemcellulare]